MTTLGWAIISVTVIAIVGWAGLSGTHGQRLLTSRHWAALSLSLLLSLSLSLLLSLSLSWAGLG